MKKRLFAIIPSICLAATALTSAAFAEKNAPKRIYHALIGKGGVLYDASADRWYDYLGDPIETAEWEIVEGGGYTGDVKTHKIYKDGKEVPALSEMAEDMLTMEVFSFGVFNNEQIIEGTPEDALAAKMRASLPERRVLSLEKDAMTVVIFTGWRPTIQQTYKFDGNYKYTGSETHHFGEIGIESYSGSGDINLDGKLTVSDAILLARVSAEDKNVKLSALARTLTDITQDGITNNADVTNILASLAGIAYSDGTDLAALYGTNGSYQPEETAVTTSAPEGNDDMPVPTTGFPDSDDYITRGTSGGDVPVIQNRELNLVEMPYQTDFALGKPIDLTGCKVDALFIDSDGYEQLNGVDVLDYPELFEVSGSAFEAKTPGEYEITIRYTREFSGAKPWEKPYINDTVTFPVTVSENGTPAEKQDDPNAVKYLLREGSTYELKVISMPRRTLYGIGDSIDLTGCVVDAKYYEDGVLKEHLDHVNLADYLDKFDMTYDFSTEYPTGNDFVYFSYPKLNGSKRYGKIMDENSFRYDYEVLAPDDTNHCEELAWQLEGVTGTTTTTTTAITCDTCDESIPYIPEDVPCNCVTEITLDPSYDYTTYPTMFSTWVTTYTTFTTTYPTMVTAYSLPTVPKN